MKKHIFFYILLVSVILSACVKAPEFPDEPVIELISIENTVIVQDIDSSYITVRFTDGNGDIGAEDNSIRDIVLKDTRPSQSNAIIDFTMPPVPALGSENGISGEIRFPRTSCCIPEGANPCTPIPDGMQGFERDTVIYEMYIEDQAGNRSNTITLDPIIILCE